MLIYFKNKEAGELESHSLNVVDRYEYDHFIGVFFVGLLDRNSPLQILRDRWCICA